MPVLSDLYTALLVEEHKAARDVAARLKEYAVGMYANAFNARTTINPRLSRSDNCTRRPAFFVHRHRSR